MSIVVVLVLLLFTFPVDWGGGGMPVCLFFVVCYCFGLVASCLVSFSVRQLSASSCSSEQASVPV